MKALYDRHVLPRLINLACGVSMVTRQREKVVPAAEGTVLEVGIGSGLNLPHYDPARVDRVIGVEPDDHIWKLSRRRRENLGFPVERVGLPGEAIPLDDASVDTVVVTYSLCTIPDALAALRQMRRVLKPGGRMLFLEHGEAPDAGVKRWQDRIQPVWGPIAGGCHLGRPIPEMIREAGFAIEDMQTAYLPGPRPMTFNYWGSARP